jgi:hypothetical protein
MLSRNLSNTEIEYSIFCFFILVTNACHLSRFCMRNFIVRVSKFMGYTQLTREHHQAIRIQHVSTRKVCEAADCEKGALL